MNIGYSDLYKFREQLQGVLTTRDFAARDFATREIFRGFKSLVLTAQSLLLVIFSLDLKSEFR